MFSVARLTGIGFGLGSAVHATAFVLLVGSGIHWYGPTYPAWRHVAMTGADAFIGWAGWRRPAWLLILLPAWVAEQIIVNGFNVECAVVIVALIALAWERSLRRAAP